MVACTARQEAKFKLVGQTGTAWQAVIYFRKSWHYGTMQLLQ